MTLSRRRVLLLLALACHLLTATGLAFDVPDRVTGSDADAFDASAYWFAVPGAPVPLALLATLLPRRAADVACSVLAGVGLAVTLLLLPLYGVGLLLLPGALLALWAAATGTPAERRPGPVV